MTYLQMGPHHWGGGLRARNADAYDGRSSFFIETTLSQSQTYSAGVHLQESAAALREHLDAEVVTHQLAHGVRGSLESSDHQHPPSCREIAGSTIASW